jgi:hypothetical protein
MMFKLRMFGCKVQGLEKARRHPTYVLRFFSKKDFFTNSSYIKNTPGFCTIGGIFDVSLRVSQAVSQNIRRGGPKSLPNRAPK